MNVSVGAYVGRYRLIERLGTGGFAEVYRAWDEASVRDVAIKIQHQNSSSQWKYPTFSQEMRSIQRLDHPHIIQILDFGAEENIPFVVMDYVHSGSLRLAHPKGSRISPETCLRYVRQAAAALQYVHDQKIIHRDLKPENFLIGENNTLLLSDFGIAFFSHSAQEPSSKEVVGTTCYMAPEQLTGNACQASDQYALAVIAYELLTGRTPFTVSPQQTWVQWALKHQQEVPLAPSQFNSAVPASMDRAILKALAKRPEERYIDVASFAAALQVTEDRYDEERKLFPIAWYKEQFEDQEQAFRAARDLDLETSGGEEDPLRWIVKYLTKPYIEKTLTHLSWTERSCLLLHIDAEFSPSEIAEILSIEEQCVYTHLESGRQEVLRTYYALLEQEQGITPSQAGGSLQKDAARVDRLLAVSASTNAATLWHSPHAQDSFEKGPAPSLISLNIRQQKTRRNCPHEEE